MSLYVRVFTNFYTHRKTARLRVLLGDDALWLVPRLWAYAAENQPDGIFSDYSPEEIASLVGYSKDAQSMLEALLKAGFLDPDPLRLHDWKEHNNYHQTFKERASKAAKVRWSKPDATSIASGMLEASVRAPIEKKGKERSKQSSSIASSMLQASGGSIFSELKQINAEAALKTQEEN